MSAILVLLFAILISSCAPVEHQSNLAQPAGTKLFAGPGDVVVRVQKTRNLENLFGASDIFGRKTDEGFSEIRFVGLAQDGALILYRKDVFIQTNETTMSRSGVTQAYSTSQTDLSGTYAANPLGGTYAGQADSTSVATIITPADDYHAVLPPDVLGLRLPPGAKDFVFEGRLITILSVSPSALTYTIEESGL